MNRRHFIYCLGGVTASIGLPITGSAADTITLTNGEWPPYTSKEFKYGGLLSRIVSEAFAAEGVTVQYEYMPWKRAYADAKDGKAAGVVGWTYTPEHLESMLRSDTIITVDKGLFHLKSTPFAWSNIEDLGKWKVGGTAGYPYGDAWEKGLKEGKFKVGEVTSDEQNIKKLIAKKIDVMAMETDVVTYLTKKLLTPEEAASVVQAPKLLVQNPFSMELPRSAAQSAELMKTFNSGLKKLKADGRLEKFIQESRNGDYAKK